MTNLCCCSDLGERITRLEKATEIDTSFEAKLADALLDKFEEAAYAGLQEWLVQLTTLPASLRGAERIVICRLDETYPTFKEFLMSLRRKARNNRTNVGGITADQQERDFRTKLECVNRIGKVDA